MNPFEPMLAKLEAEFPSTQSNKAISSSDIQTTANSFDPSCRRFLQWLIVLCAEIIEALPKNDSTLSLSALDKKIAEQLTECIDAAADKNLRAGAEMFDSLRRTESDLSDYCNLLNDALNKKSDSLRTVFAAFTSAISDLLHEDDRAKCFRLIKDRLTVGKDLSFCKNVSLDHALTAVGTIADGAAASCGSIDSKTIVWPSYEISCDVELLLNYSDLSDQRDLWAFMHNTLASVVDLKSAGHPLEEQQFDILLEAEMDKDHNSAVSEKDLRRVVLDQYIECQALVPELRTWAENFSHRPKTDPSQAVAAILQYFSKESCPDSMNDSLTHLYYAACVSSGVKPFSLGQQFLMFRDKPELLYGIRLTERFFRPIPSAKSIISDFNAAQCWKEIRSELSDAEAHLFLYAVKTAVRTSELLPIYSSFRASFLLKAQIPDLSKLKEIEERLMPLKQIIDYASGIETEIRPGEIHRSIPAMATNSADISELILHYRQQMPIVVSHLPEVHRIVLCNSLSAAAVYSNGASRLSPNLRALLYKLPDSHGEAFAFADACMKCFGYLAQDLEAMVS